MKARGAQAITPIALSACLMAAMIAMSAGDGAGALLPPGQVVRVTELWGGVTETSINGKVLRAELHVAPSTGPEEPPKAVLLNTGEHNLGYGNGYALERLSDGSWEPVENHALYTLELNGLGPGGRSGPMALTVAPRFNSSSQLLSPGDYKVTKHFLIDSAKWDGPKEFGVSARFIVED